MDGPIDITFGIELEFYIRLNRNDYDERISKLKEDQWGTNAALQRFAVKEHIVNTLRENNISVNDLEAREDNFQNWTVDEDPSIEVALDLEYGDLELEWSGIELKSPALTYSSTAVGHILRVISIINETFATRVNESTGFHVHVGNRTAGFPLQTLKNFASLVTIFERPIQSVHTEERLRNDFCAPPSTLFGPQPPLTVANLIQKIPTFGHFLDIFLPHGRRYQAYNFENLREILKTIEFRQHQGTMDGDEVGNHIHLVCGLVCASHHAGPAGFTDLIISHAMDANDDHYSFLDLLKDLTLNRLIPFYSTRLQQHRRLSHEWHKNLDRSEPKDDDASDSPSSSDDDDDDPPWGGSPEFEMRPKLRAINPDDDDDDIPTELESLQPPDPSTVDRGGSTERGDNRLAPQDQPNPRRRGADDADDADDVEDANSQLAAFNWRTGTEAEQQEDPGRSSSSLPERGPWDEIEPTPPPPPTNSPSPEFVKPRLRVTNPDEDSESP